MNLDEKDMNKPKVQTSLADFFSGCSPARSPAPLSQPRKKKNLSCPVPTCNRSFEKECDWRMHCLLKRDQQHMEALQRLKQQRTDYWNSAFKCLAQALAEPAIQYITESQQSRNRDSESARYNPQQSPIVSLPSHQDGSGSETDPPDTGKAFESTVYPVPEFSSAGSRKRPLGVRPVALPSLGLSRPRKKKRHRYYTREKMNVLRTYDEIEAELGRIMTDKGLPLNGLQSKILEILSGQTGIPRGSLKRWIQSNERARIEREILRLADDLRRRKGMKVIWSARLSRPWFPAAEEIVRKKVQ